jgi:hypothetical protein
VRHAARRAGRRRCLGPGWPGRCPSSPWARRRSASASASADSSRAEKMQRPRQRRPGSSFQPTILPRRGSGQGSVDALQTRRKWPRRAETRDPYLNRHRALLGTDANVCPNRRISVRISTYIRLRSPMGTGRCTALECGIRRVEGLNVTLYRTQEVGGSNPPSSTFGSPCMSGFSPPR